MNEQPPIMWEIVEEHFDDAAFLWSQWQAAVCSPARTPQQVVDGPEQRLIQHLEALQLFPPDKYGELLDGAIPQDRLDKLFTAILVLLHDERHRKALDAILAPRWQDPATHALYGRALGLCKRADLDAILSRFPGSKDPRFQAAGFRAMATRGRVVGPPIQAFLESADPGVRIEALRASRFVGPLARRGVEAGFAATQSDVRDAALESGLVLGSRMAYQVARQIVTKRQPEPGFALTALALSGDPADVEVIASVMEEPRLCASALWALGLSGWPRAADLCLPYLRDDDLGALAAEAFCAITGLVLDGGYVAARPESSDADDLEAEISFGPETELPRPHPDAIATWWEKNRPRFSPSRRYLNGAPRNAQTVLQALASGPMRRRPPLALELAIRSRGAYQVPIDLWTRDQLRNMAEWKVTSLPGFDEPFNRLLQA